MFERCHPTRHWVPGEKLRTQTRISLRTCVGYCAWSGSPTQLADKDPKYLYGGEVDKWTKQASEEADSLDLFLERGAEIPDRKAIIESTPQITGRSRVEHHLLTGWNCRWQCPCPKCGKYQPLIFGEGDRETGGVIFDKLNGELDAHTAGETARYMCMHCLFEIDEDQRRPMIRKGVWVPEGQSADRRGRIRGTMKNPGPKASFQLSRLYAPTFSFGRMARAFVTFHQKGVMHNWLNSWIGETWAPVRTEEDWEVVAERMGLEYSLGTVPKEAIFLTAAVDVQVDHFVYGVIAWDSNQRGWLVNYGTCNTWSQVKEVIETEYPHADDGPNVRSMMTLVDAKDGNRQDEVIDFCRSVNRDSGPFVWPCYGAKAGAMGMVPYRRNILESDNTMGKKIRNQSAAFGVVTVNTNYWQQWIHNCLYKRDPQKAESRSLAVPMSSVDDQDLFEQLMNEIPDTRKDMTNHDSYIWIKVNDGIPVDFRDVFRYCRCAAEVYTRGRWARIHHQRNIPKPTPTAPKKSAEKPSTKKPRFRKPKVRQFGTRHYGRR